MTDMILIGDHAEWQAGSRTQSHEFSHDAR